jgi:hypothetical protein
MSDLIEAIKHASKLENEGQDEEAIFHIWKTFDAALLAGSPEEGRDDKAYGDGEGAMRVLARAGFGPKRSSYLLLEESVQYEPSYIFALDCGEHDPQTVLAAISDQYNCLHAGGEYDVMDIRTLIEVIGAAPEERWLFLGDNYRKRCEGILDSRRVRAEEPRQAFEFPGAAQSNYTYYRAQFERVFGELPEGHREDVEPTFIEGPPSLHDIHESAYHAALAKLNNVLLEDGAPVSGITEIVNSSNTYAGVGGTDE